MTRRRMPLNLARLKAQVAKEARLIDRIDRRFAEDLEHVLFRLNTQIRKLVRELDTKGGKLVSTHATLGRALRLRTELNAAMDTAGYPALVNQTVARGLDKLAETVLSGRTIAARAAQMTPLNLESLGALKDMRIADLLELGERVSTTLWRTTVDGVLGFRPVPDLVDELAAVTDVSARQARTLHDTAVSTYGRTVDQLDLSGAASERFLYIGPDDDATRPFCQQQLGKVLTRGAIDDLDNGQLPNVMLTAGGYNCRHKWQFIGTLDVEDVLEDAA